MAPPTMIRPSLTKGSYTCARCAFRASGISQKNPRRWIGLKYLTKVAEAEMKWQEQAMVISQGKKKTMLSILEERGLVQSVLGDRDVLEKNMTQNRLGAYVGVDPTASSLHVGHMLPFMSLFWLYLHGYHTVSLLGGATSKIGDPTDRLTTREQVHSSIRTANMTSMHYQLKKLWQNVENQGKKHGYNWEWAWHRELVNNNAWWNKLPMLEVLQTLGPGMRMGTMLARETVKQKMQKGDGMSWAEFTYPLMQAWDWWHMYNTKGIALQIGGADQFGNITAGASAIKYIAGSHKSEELQNNIAHMIEPSGFTVPLLTTSSGAKFGKSAGNAIWLDSNQTSVFDLYGYFVQTSDADVGKFLKFFTFLPIEEIDTIVKTHMEAPHERKAQHILAREFVELIHGTHEAQLAETQHRAMFGKSPLTMSEQPLDPDAKGGQVTLNNRPNANIKLPHSLIHNRSSPRIIFAAGLADSVSDATRLINGGGIYIGGHPDGKKLPMLDGMVSWTKVHPWKIEDTAKHIIHDDLLLFRRGKHNIRIVQIVPDEVYEASGEVYNGQYTPEELAARKWEAEEEELGTLKQSNEEEKIAREKRKEAALQKALKAKEQAACVGEREGVIRKQAVGEKVKPVTEGGSVIRKVGG